MKDITQRLRGTQSDWPAALVKLEIEAAGEIDRLRDLLKRLAAVTIWESGHTQPDRAIQEEIEAALGITDYRLAQRQSRLVRCVKCGYHEMATIHQPPIGATEPCGHAFEAMFMTGDEARITREKWHADSKRSRGLMCRS